MEDFFKYLTASKDDEEWGIYLTVAGRAEISKRSSEYPLKDPGHPNGYDFRWEKGRVLNEYQIHYFTEGEGVLENSFGKFRIKQGAIMITYPGVWHRFKPSTKVGWIENYVGFKGRIADSFLSGIWFSMNKPVINSGIHEELIDTYYKISDSVEDYAC